MKSLGLIDCSNQVWYFWYFFDKLPKKFFNNFICFIIDHDFYVIFFECITPSSSLSLEEIKLIAFFIWIFHVSDFFRLFIMSFKYGLIVLRYSSTDSVFLSPLLLQKCFIITFYKKISNISNYSVFNCFIFFF